MPEPISLRKLRERCDLGLATPWAESLALVETVEAANAHNEAHLAFIEDGPEELQNRREPLRREMQVKLARFTCEASS